MESRSDDPPRESTDNSPYGLELGLFAVRIGQNAREILDQINDELRSTDLIDVEFFVLALLSEGSQQRRLQTEVLAKLSASPAKLSKAVDRLRVRKLIEIDRDPLDRRRQFLSLTALGRDRLIEAFARIDPLVRSSQAVWPPERLAQTTSHLGCLIELLCRNESLAISTESGVGEEPSRTDNPGDQGRKGAAA